MRCSTCGALDRFTIAGWCRCCGANDSGNPKHDYFGAGAL